MHSMTGFGRGQAAFGQGRIVLEIKSVNHRYLEVRSRSPRELLLAESFVEQLLKKRLGRGFCTVNLFCEGPLESGVQIDRQALENHLNSLAVAGRESGLALADLTPILASAPDLFSPAPIQDQAALKQSVERAFEEAIRSLLAMREAEGAAMAEVLRDRLAAFEQTLDTLSEQAQRWPALALDRIRERLAILLENTQAALAPERVEAEAALLADRADITEEITRIRSHLKQAAALWNADGPVGRQMEFLLQEIGREVNTVGAKAPASGIAEAVIQMKTDLEKMRELAQNVE